MGASHLLIGRLFMNWEPDLNEKQVEPGSREDPGHTMKGPFRLKGITAINWQLSEHGHLTATERYTHIIPVDGAFILSRRTDPAEGSGSDKRNCMKYQLDNFVFYDMNGLARLLFDGKEYYIYIWLDKELYIKAVQICEADRNTTVEERLDSSGLLFFYSEGATRMSPAVTGQAISIFSDVENDKFTRMFVYLGTLSAEEDIRYQLDESERRTFLKMPDNRRYFR